MRKFSLVLILLISPFVFASEDPKTAASRDEDGAEYVAPFQNAPCNDGTCASMVSAEPLTQNRAQALSRADSLAGRSKSKSTGSSSAE